RIAPSDPDHTGSRRLQATSIENAARPHALRIHLQNLDFRTRSFHHQPNPQDAGTKQLGYNDTQADTANATL
ncbi:MAG: hypothetical protein WBB85_15840, partial [Albidovulum sp.]|uniref:hypothetical protein n=1 Tax=Albidovulum sp. TaxID=1872424 RepID=UPI003C94D06A